jgi:hypothetical protein
VTVEITAQWLTEVLRRSGAIRVGEVVSCASTDMGAHNSQVSRVKVTLSSDAADSVSDDLVVKQNLDSPWAVEAGRREVEFYQAMTRSPERPPAIVPCLAAGTNGSSGDSYLILADLSATHETPVGRDALIRLAMPSARDARLVTDTLARMHAYWWEQPVAGLPVTFSPQDREQWPAYLDRRRRSWARVRASNDDLPSTVSRFFEWLLATLPVYWERDLERRTSDGRALTLVHGDSYFSNFLCPRAHDRDDVYLVDWQSPGIDIGALDLVNLIATFRTREQRLVGDWERRLLSRYHEGLSAAGVADYSLEDLHDDYRRALVTWVLIPVQDAADGSAESYWWPKMQHLLDAFEDWECARLLT